jgi:hypothetical protein
MFGLRRGMVGGNGLGGLNGVLVRREGMVKSGIYMILEGRRPEFCAMKPRIGRDACSTPFREITLRKG